MSYYIIYQTKDGLRCFTGEKKSTLSNFIRRSYSVNRIMVGWDLSQAASDTILFREYELIDYERKSDGTNWAIYEEK